MCKNKLENKWWENDEFFIFIFYFYFLWKGNYELKEKKRQLIIENVWSGNPKKKKLWHGDNVSQLERNNNNKCCISTFRYT